MTEFFPVGTQLATEDIFPTGKTGAVYIQKTRPRLKTVSSGRVVRVPHRRGSMDIRNQPGHLRRGIRNVVFESGMTNKRQRVRTERLRVVD